MVDPVSAAVASAALTKSVAKVAKEDRKEKSLLLQAAQDAGYLDPAARTLARRVAVKQQIKLKIWEPLGLLVGIQRQYFDNDFGDEMAERMADVPDDQVITPRTSIAGPTIQGISYTVDEPELKEMYLNLLATASDARVQDTAHPSFAEVIRQLNTDEAKALANILVAASHPIIEVHLNVAEVGSSNPSGYNLLATHVLDWRDRENRQVHVPLNAMYVDNWVRLGLVNVNYLNSFSDKSNYDWVETTPIMASSRRQYDTEEAARITYDDPACQGEVSPLVHSNPA